ncbi:putative MARCKS-related protein-like [Sesbania bispinosa]|nr:putative MARCKS-related protein-like [Sesbania bispinosa]
MRSCPLPPSQDDDEPSNPDQGPNDNQRKGEGKQCVQEDTVIGGSKAKQKKRNAGNSSKSVAKPTQLLARMMAANNRFRDTIRTHSDAQSTLSEVTVNDPVAVVATQNSQVDPHNEVVGGAD